MHEGAVEQLIDSHKRRTEEPLVLAIRYELKHPDDVFLLEVLDGFPGGDDDELLTTEFGPSPSLLVLGTLHLSLGSPAQVLGAAQRGDAIIDKARRGKILWSDGTPIATKLRLAIFGYEEVSR